MTRIEMLYRIMSQDPDSQPTEPTKADYERHRTWAIAAFGSDVWAEYQRGGWDRSESF